MKRECETCIKRKTMYCPSSIDCMATDDMPYYQNRIMLLEENEKLKKELEELKIYISNYTPVVTLKETIKHLYDEQKQLLNQQEEFINYLEKEIENAKYCYLGSDGKDRYRKDYFEEILAKYKEIIGDVEDESNL